MPELYLNRIFGYPGNPPVVIFNQNGYHSFGPIKEPKYWKFKKILGIYRDKRIVHILRVSQYVQDLLVNGFNLKPEEVSIIRNGLEIDLCHPQGTKSRRMAVLPRKNQRDVAVLGQLLQQNNWMDQWDWVRIVDQSTNM